MSILKIIVTSIIISVAILVIIIVCGLYFRDKKIAELKDELDKTRARLDNLERFTFELYDHFKDHLRGHRY